MITGKYWITPEGVFDVTTSEHALFAKKWLLKLPQDDARYIIKTMFRALPPKDLASYQAAGIDNAVLEFLSLEPNDPRLFVIEQHGWIRTREHAIYLWKWDAASQQRLREAAEFWKAQVKMDGHDALDVLELATSQWRQIKVVKVRGQTITQELCVCF